MRPSTEVKETYKHCDVRRYNEATGESSWTPPLGVAPVGPPPGAPPAAGAGFAATQIGKRLEAQPGTKVVPKPGLSVCVCVCVCVCAYVCVRVYIPT